MTINHYENFPVASFWLPKRIQAPIRAIYAFARTADDFADEGKLTPEERLTLLYDYRQKLDGLQAGEPPDDPVFVALLEAIHTFKLPYQPFYDLLSAFCQDVVTTRYESFEDLLDYCRRSANPVGLLMLHLYDAIDPRNHAVNARNIEESDAICTALQLINFWQDVAIDWVNKRIYLPQEDMRRFGIGEDDLTRTRITDPWRELMQFEVDRARDMMIRGIRLPYRLRGRVGWELRMVVQGGMRILEKIEQIDFDIFYQRPKIEKRDLPAMLWRAIR